MVIAWLENSCVRVLPRWQTWRLNLEVEHKGKTMHTNQTKNDNCIMSFQGSVDTHDKHHCYIIYISYIEANVSTSDLIGCLLKKKKKYIKGQITNWYNYLDSLWDFYRWRVITCCHGKTFSQAWGSLVTTRKKYHSLLLCGFGSEFRTPGGGCVRLHS